MLSISKPFKSKGKAVGYYTNYYTQQMKDSGVWFGKGAEVFGINEGQVTARALKQFLLGYSPDDGSKLVQNAGQRTPDKKARQAGWDLTFSAPKSVSVLWAMLPEEERKKIATAQLLAAKTALTFMEDNAGISRVGKAGETFVKAKLSFAMFQDFISRELDPQLHTHCVLINVGVREDGSTGALWTKELFNLKMEAGAIYRAMLAQELVKNLDVRIEPNQESFRIIGVPDKVCEEFSKRRKQIASELKRAGRHDAITAKAAAIKTRRASPKTSINALLPIWQKSGWLLGFGPHEAKSAINLPKEPREEITRRFLNSVEEQKARTKDEPAKEETRERQIKAAEEASLKRTMLGEVLEKGGKFTQNFFHIKHWELAKDGPRLQVTYDVRERRKKTKVVKARTIIKLPYVKVGPKTQQWGYITKKKSFGIFGELRVQEKYLFPHSPISAIRKIKIPAVRYYHYTVAQKLGKILDGEELIKRQEDPNRSSQTQKPPPAKTAEEQPRKPHETKRGKILAERRIRLKAQEIDHEREL